MRRIIIITKIFVLSLILNFSTIASEREFVYLVSSDYGQVYVVQNKEGMRCLYIGDPNNQADCIHTCINIYNPDLLEFDYQKFALSSLYAVPKPQKILVLGLGGGTLIKALMDLLPQAKIDVVEINDAIFEVAKEYFSFKPNVNTSVVISDGYEFVKKQAQDPALKKYDLIILDAFDKDYIPAQFLSKEFVHMVHSIVAAKGVVVVNTFANSKYATLEDGLYKDEFKQFLNLKTSNGNRLIITSPDVEVISPAFMQKNTFYWEGLFKKHIAEPKILMQSVNKAAVIK